MHASALVLTSPTSPASMERIDVPDPAPGQVRIRVEAATVNGFDRALVAGWLWHLLPAPTFPVGVGRDLVGTIESAGAQSGLTPAQRVAAILPGPVLGPGTVAEYVTLDAAQITPLPDVDSDALTTAACTGLAVLTAAGMDSALHVDRGDVVLVTGATGGVGSALVPLLVSRGVRVLATARREERAQAYVESLGAEVVAPVGDGCRDAVGVATPDGVHAVAHLAGDPAESAAHLRPGGRLISPLGATSEQVGRDDVTVQPYIAETTSAAQADLLARMADGGIVPRISAVYPFEKAVDALSAMLEPKLGKVVVAVL